MSKQTDKSSSIKSKKSKDRTNEIAVVDDNIGAIRSFWRFLRAVFIIDEDRLERTEYEIDEHDHFENKKSSHNSRASSVDLPSRKSRKLLSIEDNEEDEEG